MRIELFPRRNILGQRRWYFRFRADNGQIIAHSEAYSRRIDALSTAKSIQASAAVAEIIEVER